MRRGVGYLVGCGVWVWVWVWSTSSELGCVGVVDHACGRGGVLGVARELGCGV